MPEFVRPPRLRPGATIGVAAISGPVDPARLEAGIARLVGLGYRVVEASNLRRAEGLFAGSDAERAEGYRALLADPAVDAIFFARGGWGAARLLHRLDPAEIASRPRIHLGGSDLTSLFAFLGARGLPAFYGPMVAVEIAEQDGLDWENVVSGGPPAEHRFEPGDVLSPGSGEGPLAGGCLTLLASLCGTPEAVRPEGGVLFWEEIGEEIYRLDRMLTQLERSGTFDHLQAMVIGSVVSRDRAEAPERVREYLRDRFRGSPFPVAAGFPAGHLRRPRTLPLGAAVRLELGEPARLSFPEPAVL
ncbi:MAG: S66 peptidase family protein [Thermoanaerobaculia bacterium]